MDAEIIWDLEDDLDGNIDHIAEHGITVEEVEEVLRGTLGSSAKSRRSGRPIAFG